MSTDQAAPADFDAALDREHDAALGDFLFGEDEPPFDVPGSATFTITDASSADWAVRKIKRARDRLAEAMATAAEQIAAVEAEYQRVVAPINAWLELQRQDAEQDVRFFSHLLEVWHAGLLAEDPKRKTVRLPHGSISARRVPGKWTFAPEFIEWAKANAPELLRVKHEADVAAAKAKFERVTNLDGDAVLAFEGEPVPGVEIEEDAVRFRVSTEVASGEEAEQ